MRKQLIHFLLITVLMVCSATTMLAQNTAKGQVVDAESNEPLIGASVTMEGTTEGSVTDLDGYFTLQVRQGQAIVIKYLGYKGFKTKITQSGNVNLGVIKLDADAVLLDGIVVTSMAVARKTPVALSTVPAAMIEQKVAMNDFPSVLKSTPGVYVIKSGGGYGDSDLMMRGFESPNVAVMVNGVPMNDMEWGGLYWSNWAGLADVTRTMQTQRGMGASKVAAPSVGGSINIVTKSTDAEKGGTVSYSMGNYGYNKISFSVSTGLSKSGWAMTLLGGKTWGDGYIQGTEFEGYNYFLNIAKRINDNHQLSLTALGAPQWHNQRQTNDGLTIKGWQEVQKYMEPGEQYRYNATYGFGKNGERKFSALNKYHKPQISLNHQWQIDQTSSLSTALYLSIGDGYGYSGQTTSAYGSAWYGSTNGILNTKFRNADGTFAYDQVQELNEQSLNGSQMVMSVSKNNHKWYGLLSTYTKELNDQINFYAGVDMRYYIGTHTNEIIDLYNGAYYIDRNRVDVKAENYAGAGTDAFKNQKLSVGDVVYRDYDGNVMQGGVFGQVEYDNDKLTVLVSGSASETSQWRYDRFYYDAAHAKSDKVNKFGYTAKAGTNYNLTENHNFFANVGYISRAPFFSNGAFLQSITSNQVNEAAVNEKAFSIELGYGFRSRYLTANLNAYHTQWMDKTMAKSAKDEVEIEGGLDRPTINMQGVDATHQGIELDLVAKPFSWLDIHGMFSIGNWRWTSNPVGYWYTSSGQPLTKNNTIASGIEAPDHAKTTIELDGVRVGGAAQTTASLGANVRLGKAINVGLDWNLFARNYADWTISTDMPMDGTVKYYSPWRIPSANVFDLNASYTFTMAGFKATLSGNVDNIFDQEYIESAYDGSGHDWESAYRVFYGFGRSASVRLKLQF